METSTHILLLKVQGPFVPNTGLPEAASVLKNWPPTLYEPSKYRMAINTAAYRVPPRPMREKGDKAARDCREHRGYSTNAVSMIMTLLLAARMAGKLKLSAKAEKLSAIIME